MKKIFLAGLSMAIIAFLSFSLLSFSSKTVSHDEEKIKSETLRPNTAPAPIWDPSYVVCGVSSVYLPSANLPKGVSFNWIGAGSPCTQNIAPVSNGSNLVLTGTGPSNSFCKYRYTLTNSSGTYTYIFGIRLLPSPCQ